MTPAISSSMVREQARELYKLAPLPGRWIQQNRPRICPFDKLISYFPANGSVLDIGCGSGLLLGLLGANARLGAAIGFDSSEKAIGLARRMSERLPAEMRNRVQFLRLDARDDWPDGLFDVVSLVDVMHHVPPASQREVFNKAVAKVAPKGRFIYKDMAQRPLWSAWANRLHDLVMAREWINYRSIQDVRQWGLEADLKIVDEGRTRLVWYTHEHIVFEKTA